MKLDAMKRFPFQKELTAAVRASNRIRISESREMVTIKLYKREGERGRLDVLNLPRHRKVG